MTSAAILARYCQLSYENLATVRAALPAATVRLLDRRDSQAYAIETETETVIAFRGTQWTATDIWRNAEVANVPWSWGRGTVHEGYNNALNAILDDLTRIVIQARRPLTYTGHSLGGAVATLARGHAPSPDLTVTFGAPKAGDSTFTEQCSHIPMVRYVHARDIAPKHPRVWQGYRHGGSLVRLARDGQRTERDWNLWDEIILPFSLSAGARDHRIEEYVAKLGGGASCLPLL